MCPSIVQTVISTDANGNTITSLVTVDGAPITISQSEIVPITQTTRYTTEGNGAVLAIEVATVIVDGGATTAVFTATDGELRLVSSCEMSKWALQLVLTYRKPRTAAGRIVEVTDTLDVTVFSTITIS